MPADTPANRAMAQYFRKTFAGGAKRETYAGAQATSVMTVLRDEYRELTTARMKREVGTAKFLHGADLDKLSNFAQDRAAWALLVSISSTRVESAAVGAEGRRAERT